MIYVLQDGTNVTRTQFVIDSITYPSNWAELASPEERTIVGILTLTEVYPELPDGYKYSTFTDDLVALTRTYSITN